MKAKNIPPIIEIFCNEKFFGLDSPEDLKYIMSDTGLVRSLMDQAEWTFKNFTYADEKDNYAHSDFIMTPSLTMNPFHPSGKCYNNVCLMGSQISSRKLSVFMSIE